MMDFIPARSDHIYLHLNKIMQRLKRKEEKFCPQCQFQNNNITLEVLGEILLY